jgi:hypothetical protein
MMKCTVEICSGGMMYVPNSMKIGTEVEGIIRSCLSNLKVCNIGITERKWFRKCAVEMALGGMIYYNVPRSLVQSFK